MHSATSHAALHAIQQTGLLALIEGIFPLDELLPIGDAFLAAPVLAVALSWRHPEILAALEALQQRFGSHLALGVMDVTTQAQAWSARISGAQFVLTAPAAWLWLDPGFARHCLVLPQVTTAGEVESALAAGAQGVQLAADQADGLALLTALHHSHPELAIIVRNPTLPYLPAWASAGATAVAIDSLVPFDWSARTIITQARRYRHLWTQGSKIS